MSPRYHREYPLRQPGYYCRDSYQAGKSKL